MENEGDSVRREASARKPNLNQKRKAEDEARGDDKAKSVKQPQNPSTEPTTVVFVQVLVPGHPAIPRGNSKPMFLIGPRTIAPGVGKWSFPGGPLPPNETIWGAATHYLGQAGRVLERAADDKFRLFRATDTFMVDEITGKPQHLVTLFVISLHQNDISSTDPFLPTKEHKYMDWSSISNLNPLFEPLVGLMDQTVKVEKKILVDWKSQLGPGV